MVLFRNTSIVFFSHANIYMQRGDDSEPDETDSVSDMPVILPRTTASQAKLDHLARARAKKAELAQQRAEERAKAREETTALSRGVKAVKDPQSREVIKNEILKATALRPKKQVPVPAPPPAPEPIQKARKQPKVVLEDSEPEVIYVKVPKKKIVVQQSETETETEPEPVKPKSRRSVAPRRKQPVETDSSDYESDFPQQPVRKQALKPPTAYQPPQFKINF